MCRIHAVCIQYANRQQCLEINAHRTSKYPHTTPDRLPNAKTAGHSCKAAAMPTSAHTDRVVTRCQDFCLPSLPPMRALGAPVPQVRILGQS